MDALMIAEVAGLAIAIAIVIVALVRAGRKIKH